MGLRHYRSSCLSDPPAEGGQTSDSEVDQLQPPDHDSHSERKLISCQGLVFVQQVSELNVILRNEGR
jgi:hypothetical protein